ncbi:MAG TPA: DUF4129 domain-containing protein [Thermoanaerobaculia bacterium]|nr:DUF4129 domain-containing protein [Thermoanaerobaculia bacterium]
MSRSRAPLDESPATFLTHHVVVPAAVIAMAASFLFYLADLRSAFLGGSRALKWVGFCFVVATVLNERYGRSSGGDAHLQKFFTLALAGATTVVLLFAPWETPRGSLWLTLANLLILAVVWHFATRITRELSPETGRDIPRTGQLGWDLLLFEPRLADEAAVDAPQPEATPASPRNPAATVARLAAAVLLTFALSEPIVLGAAPQTGAKALAAVMVFLFSTGVVLAAGSALDALRRAESAGGRVAPGLVPGRMALAALLLGAVLASALALPGLHLQGTGGLRPPTTHGEGVERERGNQETDHPGQPNATIPGKVTGDHLRSDASDTSQATSPPESPEKSPGESPQPSTLSRGPVAGSIGWLAAIGKWLLISLILTLLCAGIWGLARLWPLLKSWRIRAWNRWRALLDRLAGLLGRLSGPRRRNRPGFDQGADPLTGSDDLLDWPSREAVLAAYHRFLALLESLGHSRPETATPYEILEGLPPHLRPLEKPARTLTDLYVQAAYAAEPVERGAQERAIGALKALPSLALECHPEVLV